MAQPHKGDRRQFQSRIPAPVAQRVVAEAEARGISYSEFIAAAVAQQVGLPGAAPMPAKLPEGFPMTG